MHSSEKWTCMSGQYEEKRWRGKVNKSRRGTGLLYEIYNNGELNLSRRIRPFLNNAERLHMMHGGTH